MNRPTQNKRPFRAGGRGGRRDPDSPSASGPPEETFREPEYLRRLVDDQTTIIVRLRNNEEFEGVLEYYDESFIRLTRKEAPNLFIYKHDIKYMSEQPEGAS